MNLIDKDALIEALGIETDCYDCEHETIIYHCDLDQVTVCEKIIQAPVITLTTESAEKAIEVLKNAAWLGAVYSFEETEEAVKTAIRALQVTSAQPNVHDSVKDADCISRQQAIDTAVTFVRRTLLDSKPIDVKMSSDYIFVNLVEPMRKLPSAQSYTEAEIQRMQGLEQAEIDKAFELGKEEGRKEAQPKTGKWIKNYSVIRCSECKRSSWSLSFEDLVRSFNYCPNCGAKMLKEGE